MHWYGLNWLDIVLNVFVLAIVPRVLAVYGGQLAAEGVADAKRRIKIQGCFWGLFLLLVAFTSWQQIRIAEADLANQKLLG
jgi:DMSO/TMAO reductase YedYZ heme-binding membrane subunit